MMRRCALALGTGITNQHEQPKTVSRYIYASAVYGGNKKRLEWLCESLLDGNLSSNKLLLNIEGNLPTANYRGNLSPAPKIENICSVGAWITIDSLNVIRLLSGSITAT